MKDSHKQKIRYQNEQRLRLEKINNDILNDSLTNPLLSRAGELPDYFKQWIDGSKLVAVLPALSPDNQRAQTYYSAPSLLNEGDLNYPEPIRISPVFMYVNPEFINYDDSNTNNKRVFVFDSEHSKMYSYEKKTHSQDYHFVKTELFDEIQSYLNEHPVVLFFKGCDDGHIGKRFKTEADAMDYLKIVDVFEDVYEDEHEVHN